MNNHRSSIALNREGLDALPSNADRGFPHPSTDDYDHSDASLAIGNGDAGHTVPALEGPPASLPRGYDPVLDSVRQPGDDTILGEDVILPWLDRVGLGPNAEPLAAPLLSDRYVAFPISWDLAGNPTRSIVRDMTSDDADPFTLGPYDHAEAVALAARRSDGIRQLGWDRGAVHRIGMDPLARLAADVAIVRRAGERAMTARGLPPSMDEPREDGRDGQPGEVPEEAPRRPGGERGEGEREAIAASAIREDIASDNVDEFPSNSFVAAWVASLMLVVLAAGVAIGFLMGRWLA